MSDLVGNTDCLFSRAKTHIKDAIGIQTSLMMLQNFNSHAACIIMFLLPRLVICRRYH